MTTADGVRCNFCSEIHPAESPRCPHVAALEYKFTPDGKSTYVSRIEFFPPPTRPDAPAPDGDYEKLKGV